jgi:hypothetical protein
MAESEGALLERFAARRDAEAFTASIAKTCRLWPRVGWTRPACHSSVRRTSTGPTVSTWWTWPCWPVGGAQVIHPVVVGRSVKISPGGFVNMGAYGGTPEASKTYFGEPICETIVAGESQGQPLS